MSFLNVMEKRSGGYGVRASGDKAEVLYYAQFSPLPIKSNAETCLFRSAL
jgi:hypothetical protein